MKEHNALKEVSENLEGAGWPLPIPGSATEFSPT